MRCAVCDHDIDAGADDGVYVCGPCADELDSEPTLGEVFMDGLRLGMWAGVLNHVINDE